MLQQKFYIYVNTIQKIIRRVLFHYFQYIYILDVLKKCREIHTISDSISPLHIQLYYSYIVLLAQRAPINFVASVPFYKLIQ